MKPSHLMTRAQWERFAKRILRSRKQAWNRGNWLGIYQADVLRAMQTFTAKHAYAEKAWEDKMGSLTKAESLRFSPWEAARLVWFRHVTKESRTEVNHLFYADFNTPKPLKKAVA